jgi:hypothetical protein
MTSTGRTSTRSTSAPAAQRDQGQHNGRHEREHRATIASEPRAEKETPSRVDDRVLGTVGRCVAGCTGIVAAVRSPSSGRGRPGQAGSPGGRPLDLARRDCRFREPVLGILPPRGSHWRHSFQAVCFVRFRRTEPCRRKRMLVGDFVEDMRSCTVPGPPGDRLHGTRGLPLQAGSRPSAPPSTTEGDQTCTE